MWNTQFSSHRRGKGAKRAFVRPPCSILDLSHCPLSDIDGLADLERLAAALARPFAPSPPPAAGSPDDSNVPIGRWGFHHEPTIRDEPQPPECEAAAHAAAPVVPRPVGALRGLVLRHCALSERGRARIVDAMLALQYAQRNAEAQAHAVGATGDQSQ